MLLDIPSKYGNMLFRDVILSWGRKDKPLDIDWGNILSLGLTYILWDVGYNVTWVSIQQTKESLIYQFLMLCRGYGDKTIVATVPIM